MGPRSSQPTHGKTYRRQTVVLACANEGLRASGHRQHRHLFQRYRVPRALPQTQD